MPPPPPPSSAQTASDRVAAALAPHFAAHLLQEAPAAGDRRVRFSPQTLWDYMCYCFGYGAAEARLGKRAHRQRKAARAHYVLRESSEADACAAAGAGAGAGNGASYGWSPRYTLWLKGRRGAPPRAVVSTDEIVATVMRVHRELGHADAPATSETVTRAYCGITKTDVQWVVAHCPDCSSGAAQPFLLSPSSSPALATRRMAMRASARKTAAVSADTAGAATDNHAANRSGSGHAF
jgi:hypothetical protein